MIKTYLNKLKELTLSDIFNIPVAVQECYECGEPEPIYTRFNHVPICHNCYEGLEICGYCERRQLNITDGICEPCRTNSAVIEGCGYRPEPLFHRVQPNRIGKPPLITDTGHYYYGRSERKRWHEHYGVEIECDHHRDGGEIVWSGNRIASLINLIGKGMTSKEKLLYVKRDGTALIEIVSHPFSWNYFTRYGKEIFRVLFDKLKENNLYAHWARDCGFHVHVSRKALSPINIYKLALFLYKGENYQFILDVSQRSESRLEQWSSLDQPVGYRTLIRACVNNDVACEEIDRYTALNLQNRNTIEFRIFRGTLNFNTFCKNLEFVRSLVKWVKVTSISTIAKDGGLGSYLEFLRWNYNDYENLCYFLSNPEDEMERYAYFPVIVERWIRERSGRVTKLVFNSDKRELD